MARGQPDYGMYAPSEQYATLSDLAELARRLTSLIYFDSRGLTVYKDDFEDPILKWIVGKSIGGEIVFDYTYPQSGGQCIKLTPLGEPACIASISKEFGVVASQRLGSEISFANPSDQLSFYTEIAYFDGADFYRGAARLNFNTNKLYLRTGSGEWTEYTSIDAFYTSGYTYSHLKLVCDFSTNKYVRVILNGDMYDISTYSLAVMGGAGAKRLQQTHLAYNETWSSGSIFIDDSIFTQEEP